MHHFGTCDFCTVCEQTSFLYEAESQTGLLEKLFSLFSVFPFLSFHFKAEHRGNEAEIKTFPSQISRARPNKMPYS